ncbi:DMT family transporter [Thalassospira lucentensis]|uniref:DMT family transporter n=1 Tax=Thalassospira lucentensis TaxID=168935 RepID=UPI003AA8FD4E
MMRWQANILIVFVALIWGTTFIVQQTGMENIGPQYFTGVRFLLGALVVLPFAWREFRKIKREGRSLSRGDMLGLLATGIAMYLASILQQIGLMMTTVTNAAFLTAFYVPTVPVLAFLVFRARPHWSVWPGGAMCILGTYMLSGGNLSALDAGDFWVMSSALFWATQVVMIGVMVSRTNAPALVSTTQFVIAGILAMVMGAMTETFSFANIYNAGFEILYAGVMSVGLAFTLQAVAQNYTEAADAAIIMSAEAVFAAIAAAWFLGERLAPAEYAGCGVILAAIVGVQLLPVMGRRRRVVV